MTYDLQSLTLGELEDVERRSGMGIGTLQDPAAPKMKLYRAIILAFQRRDDPRARWDDTGALTMAEMETMLGAAPDPTHAQQPGG